MNRNEVKAQRIRLGYTQGNVAEKMKMNIHTYRKKEAGGSPFKETEKLALARILELTPSQMNAFLFDNKLPIGKNSEPRWN